MISLQIQTVTNKVEVATPHHSHRFGRNTSKWAAKYVMKKSLQFKSGMNVLGAYIEYYIYIYICKQIKDYNKKVMHIEVQKALLSVFGLYFKITEDYVV